MSKKSKRVRRTSSNEFKQDAVNLIVKQGYSFKSAAEDVNVSSRSLREWHEKLAPQPEPCGDDASVTELQAEIKRLRKQLQNDDSMESACRNTVAKAMKKMGLKN